MNHAKNDYATPWFLGFDTEVTEQRNPSVLIPRPGSACFASAAWQSRGSELAGSSLAIASVAPSNRSLRRAEPSNIQYKDKILRPNNRDFSGLGRDYTAPRATCRIGNVPTNSALLSSCSQSIVFSDHLFEQREISTGLSDIGCTNASALGWRS